MRQVYGLHRATLVLVFLTHGAESPIKLGRGVVTHTSAVSSAFVFNFWDAVSCVSVRRQTGELLVLAWGDNRPIIKRSAPSRSRTRRFDFVCLLPTFASAAVEQES